MTKNKYFFGFISIILSLRFCLFLLILDVLYRKPLFIFIEAKTMIMFIPVFYIGRYIRTNNNQHTPDVKERKE